MMTEETFHLSLRQNPSDELTWLALADWLEESGQSERAELLRLSRRMAMMPLDERGDLPMRVEALLRGGVKPVVVEQTNALGMRLALVPAGRFLMGSPPEEDGRFVEEVLHEVTITRAFWLGVFPVTQAQWQAVMGKNPSYFRSGGAGKAKVKGLDTSDFPVEQVSWKDAQTFLKKLNERTEEGEKEWKYSLPTEGQWEYACRGGASSSPYHFGDTISKDLANYNQHLGRTSKVGSYPANAFGLHDMHGNVWEWCHDWHDPDYYQNENSRQDPRGPQIGSSRVLRGGSWYDDRDYCRAACRLYSGPADRYDGIGVRVCFRLD